MSTNTETKTTKKKAAQGAPETATQPAGVLDGQPTADATEGQQVAPGAAQTDAKQTAGAQPVVIKRVLRVAKPLMKGEDVEAVQLALIAAGYGCGVEGANGVFNAATAAATRHFQSMKRLIVNGRVDALTARALGAEWEE